MIDSMLFATRQDIAVMLSRILIGIAYGSGGVFALLGKAGPVGFDPTTSGSLPMNLEGRRSIHAGYGPPAL